MLSSDRSTIPFEFAVILSAGLLTSLVVAGCGADDAATKGSDEEVAVDTPRLTITKNDEGQIVKRYDTDGDGKANVVEYLEEFPDPNDPNITRKRLVKKLVDVNGDARFDIVKEYNDQGVLMKETVDDNLDGTKDRISYYSAESKSLSRKEVFGKNGESVIAKRFYTGGKLDRAEKDTDGDGKMDLFEYYSGGDIERIGRDTNGDGKIDRWRHASRKETAASAGRGDAPTVPNPTESGSGGEGEGGESENGGESSEGETSE